MRINAKLKRDESRCVNIMDNSKKTSLAELSGRASRNAHTSASLSNAVEPDTPTQLPEVESTAELLRDLFDASACAIVVVDRECQLKAINTSAKNTIGFSTKIRVSAHGILQLLDDQMYSTLREHVTKVTSGNTYRSPLLLCESASEKEPFARINPLQTTESGNHNILALITFSAFKSTLYDHRLAFSLYGLSRAELAICEKLVPGNTVKQISESRGTTTYTVHSQLKSIFAKTHTKSQLDLVSLLLRATPPPNFK